ncbi:MAG TPA: hypothetical protein VFS43_04035 [Polyangiaceae bacterium]|nr:hypothetical protein [Polyangiaceae bacterium]
MAALPLRLARSICRLLPLCIVDVGAEPVPVALYWHERTHDDEGARYFRRLVAGALAGPGPAWPARRAAGAAAEAEAEAPKAARRPGRGARGN